MALARECLAHQIGRSCGVDPGPQELADREVLSEVDLSILLARDRVAVLGELPLA